MHTANAKQIESTLKNFSALVWDLEILLVAMSG
jgi:hypothetical protein